MVGFSLFFLFLSPFLSWRREWNPGQHKCRIRTQPVSYAPSLDGGLCFPGGFSLLLTEVKWLGTVSPTETSALIFLFMSKCATKWGRAVGGMTQWYSTC